jgi:hypothetical protein
MLIWKLASAVHTRIQYIKFMQYLQKHKQIKQNHKNEKQCKLISVHFIMM